ASAIGVAANATLNLSGAISTGGSLVKLGGGTLELSGAFSNSGNVSEFIKQGTLRLNKSPGASALASSGQTIVIGDDDSTSGTATLRFEGSNEMPSNNIVVASNGVLDLNGKDQVIGNLTMTVAPAGGSLGGGKGNIGAGGTGTTGTMVLNGNVTVFPLSGAGGADNTVGGATINGGTLALQVFGGGATTRAFQVNDGVSGAELAVSSGITDGTPGAQLSLTKSGFGEMRFDGGTVPNTYTGTTTVNEGTLTLNKTAGTSAMNGALSI